MYNEKNLKPFRKILRNNATPAERSLWVFLRSRAVKGKKFRRQYSIGKYIVDFYCPEKRLAIELDGQVHQTDRVYIHDLAKQAFLKSKNIMLLRFENRLIFENLERVISEIEKHL